MSAVAVGYPPEGRDDRIPLLLKDFFSLRSRVSTTSDSPARRVIVRNALIAIVLIALSLLADGWVAQHVRYGRVYETDWGRMLRTFGYLPFWLLAAIALAMDDRESREWWRRGALLAAAPTAAGIVGELLKITVRRMRPPDEGSVYSFRAYSDHPFSSRGFGFPSSHAVVAFGAAAILARMFPRARVVWYTAAVGCAVSRLLAHAHYLSDVVAAALIGIAVAALVWRYAAPRTA
jgi:membrane-associated phospholipid phosphatase